MPIFKSGSVAGRPRSGQMSNIRGRISAPIMVDDEFPMRTPGSGIAHVGSPLDLHSSPSANTPEDDNETVVASIRQSNRDQLQHRQTDLGVTPSPDEKRTTMPLPGRASTATQVSASNPPQRKKSTFRSALGKLFGRKRKDTGGSRDSGTDTSYNETGAGSIQHRSVSLPTIPNQPTGKTQKMLTANFHTKQPPAPRQPSTDQGDVKRSTSFPIPEYERALRSHSVGPGDMLAIESARNSMMLEPASTRQRAASSSLIASPIRKDFDGELIGLAPRPASANGEIRVVTEETQDPDEIGRALSIYEPTSHRPRSKSLTGMPSVVETQSTTRNRSDEIRYWRESYQPRALSPTHEDEGIGHVEDVEQVPTSDTPRTIPQAFPLSPEDLHFETPSDSPAISPRPVAYTTTAHAKLGEPSMSLEDRVMYLEAHARKLEKLVSQLFELVSGNSQYAKSPQTMPRSPQSFANTTNAFAPQCGTSFSTTLRDNAPSSRQSNESFGDAYTYVGSYPAAPKLVARPVSNNATVREVSSLPSLPRELQGTLGTDHYTTLKALLETERANRQILEAQVTKLSYRLNRLSRTSGTLDARKRGFYSAFDDDDDDYEGQAAATDEYGSEIFQTPHEEYDVGAHQAFGPLPPILSTDFNDDSDKENQDSPKKNPRTLSLGQLTLPKSSRVATDGDVVL